MSLLATALADAIGELVAALVFASMRFAGKRGVGR